MTNEVNLLTVTAAVFAILMSGSGQSRTNLLLYAMQTFFIALACFAQAEAKGSSELYIVVIGIIAIKVLTVPYFLSWLANKIEARSDPGAFLPIPLTMHVSILLFGLSHFLALGLPVLKGIGSAAADATGAISLLLTGMLFMLTRRFALGQIIGFLTLENGIFLFAVTQTKGMPFIIEMGILLDVLVAVMIGGLFVFHIKRSFEHIDVTQLNGLKE